MAHRLCCTAVLGATLLVAAGCASSGPYWNQADQGAAEATELRERVARLETELAAAAQRNQALEAQAAAFERELERLRLPPGTGEGAESQPSDPAPISELAEAPPAVRDRAAIEQSDLPEADEPAESEAPLAAVSDGPRERYEQSLALLEQGRLPEAEEGFRRFLAENPASDLADNAQFWLAESALRRADVDAALAGFRAVVESYPEGNKVPDALLKVGSCLATLGEVESAATVYRELLARFPETAAAETARQRLGNP